MSASETNAHTVRRLFEDGFNGDRPDVVGELVSSELAGAEGARGAAMFDQVMTHLRAAFPDLHYTLDDVIADGDRVVVRWHWRGTHGGPFRGVAATGRAVTNTGFGLFRLRDGKITAATIETDRLGFLQAIGVVPALEVLFQPR